MSPMLDIQKRHAEVFRIRLGEKGSKGEPRKLTDSIRITSPNRSVVQAFADVFGGDVRDWDGQFEVYLPTTELPIMVLPGQSVSQWWEMYRKSVCERRCDGVTETLSGQACMCPADITDRMAAKGACRPMTRLNVVCPDVAVVGAGSLVTHSMIAAETLPQSIAVAEAALARGLMVPAVLRVVEHKGKTHYIVPQLEIVGMSLTQLTTGEVPAPRAVAAPEPVKAIAPAPAKKAPPRPPLPPVGAMKPTTPPAMAKVEDVPMAGVPTNVRPAHPAQVGDITDLIAEIKAAGDEWHHMALDAWKAAGLPAKGAAELSEDQAAVAFEVLGKVLAKVPPTLEAS